MISIIVPCYNSKKFIDKNLSSLIKQTCNEFQVIFIDDGSIDNIGMYIREKLENYNIRFQVHGIGHKGVGYARNLGVNLTSTPYTIFLDADDYLMENTIEIIVNSIKNQPSDIIFGEYIHELNDKIVWNYEDVYKKINYDISGEELLNFIFNNEIHICTGSIIFKTELLKKGLFKEDCLYDEDLNLYYKIIATAETVKFIPSILMVYVIREKSLSHDLNVNKLKQGISMFEDLMETFIREGISSEVIQKINTKVIPNTCLLFFNKLCLIERNIVDIFRENGYFKKMRYAELENRSMLAFVKYFRIKLIGFCPNLYKNVWRIYQLNVKKLIRR
jgi:glycosyltransferase involved in cell wall biosynthesis